MQPMTIKYQYKGEERVAHTTTAGDFALLLGIIDRAEGYVIKAAYVTPDTNPGELPEYSELTPYR